MMKKSQEEQYGQMVFYGMASIAAVSVLLVFVLLVLTAYVRWTMNQEFTFLGGSEFEALTISAFALTYATVRLYHGRKCCCVKEGECCAHGK